MPTSKVAKEEEVEVVARKSEQCHNGHCGCNGCRPSAPLSGDDNAGQHDECRYERRDEIDERGPEPEDEDADGVEDGIHAPKGVDRQRPPVKRKVTGCHGLSLQHDRGTVRIAGNAPSRQVVQQDGQPGAGCHHRSDRANLRVLITGPWEVAGDSVRLSSVSVTAVPGVITVGPTGGWVRGRATSEGRAAVRTSVRGGETTSKGVDLIQGDELNRTGIRVVKFEGSRPVGVKDVIHVTRPADIHGSLRPVDSARSSHDGSTFSGNAENQTRRGA